MRQGDGRLNAEGRPSVRLRINDIPGSVTDATELEVQVRHGHFARRAWQG